LFDLYKINVVGDSFPLILYNNNYCTLFTECLGVETSVINAIRIGKKSGRACLLKITVSNLQDKAISRNKSKLGNGNNLNQEKPVYLSADYTPLEQKY